MESNNRHAAASRRAKADKIEAVLRRRNDQRVVDGLEQIDEQSLRAADDQFWIDLAVDAKVNVPSERTREVICTDARYHQIIAPTDGL